MPRVDPFYSDTWEKPVASPQPLPKGYRPSVAPFRGMKGASPFPGGVETRATLTSELAELFASHETFLDDFQRHALGFRHEEEGQQDERGVQTGKEPESA